MTTKSEFEKMVKIPKSIDYVIYDNKTAKIYFNMWSRLHSIIELPTKSKYTFKNADAINTFAVENKEMFKEWAKQHSEQMKAYRKTPEYKHLQRMKQAMQMATEAGLSHDEHGGYSSGDYHTLSIKDIVHTPAALRKLHASGKMLALVEDSRKRVYSKAYMRNFGAGYRSDVYLVGRNENGVAFVHGVPKTIENVADAVNWIWRGVNIISRQGDVAITSTNRKKDGENVIDVSILDNHHFTGEIARNGSTYIRNGVLFHTKDQHPSIKIGNEWVRVVIGRRSAVGGSDD